MMQFAMIAAFAVSAWAPTQSRIVAVAFSTGGETYTQDQTWGNEIDNGACSRLKDRRTDAPADISQCNRDYAATPVCISYEGFASAWYDMANGPNPQLRSPDFAMSALNDLGTKDESTDPPYYRSPDFKDGLRRLLNVAFSNERNKWGTRDEFSKYAYKLCMEGHPF